MAVSTGKEGRTLYRALGARAGAQLGFRPSADLSDFGDVNLPGQLGWAAQGLSDLPSGVCARHRRTDCGTAMEDASGAPGTVSHGQTDASSFFSHHCELELMVPALKLFEQEAE
jgi:hypothetical protein